MLKPPIDLTTSLRRLKRSAPGAAPSADDPASWPLEPAAMALLEAGKITGGRVNMAAALSQAISAKRGADLLERIALAMGVADQ